MRLSQRAAEVLQLLDRENKPLSSSRICGKLNVAPNNVQQWIRDLFEAGLIDRANASEFKINANGMAYLRPLEATEDAPLTDHEMDKLLDAAVEEVAEPIHAVNIPDFVPQDKSTTEALENLEAFGADNERNELLLAFKLMAGKMQPIKIDRLDIKIETLGLLASISAPVIANILSSIVDDLTKISEK